MVNLIVWHDGQSVHLYAVPVRESSDYVACHGAYVNGPTVPDDAIVKAMIKHLSYRLGEEPWLVDGDVPALLDFIKMDVLGHGKGVRANAYEPPLKQYILEGVQGTPPEVGKPVKNIIITGWIMRGDDSRPFGQD